MNSWLKTMIPYGLLQLYSKFKGETPNPTPPNNLGERIQEVRQEYGYVGLHMGCGPIRHSGYLNCDLDGGEFYVDATKPLPISSDSLDYVYSEHFIEHLAFDEALFFMRESFRVLRQHGIFRCLTPDFSLLLCIADSQPELVNKLQRRITEGLISQQGVCIEVGVSSDQALLWDSRDDIINTFMRRWGHRYLWSAHHLAKAVNRAGFREVAVLAYGASRDSRVCLEPKIRFGQEWTLAVEGYK